MIEFLGYSLEQRMLVISAIFATLAVLSRDDVYAAFSLGSVILFTSLYVIFAISAVIGIIIFAVYTASVIGLIFIGYGEEEGGLTKLSVISVILALAIAIVLNEYLPHTTIGTIEVSVDTLKSLIIPIAAGISAIVVAGQEVRGE